MRNDEDHSFKIWVKQRTLKESDFFLIQFEKGLIVGWIDDIINNLINSIYTF